MRIAILSPPWFAVRGARAERAEQPLKDPHGRVAAPFRVHRGLNNRLWGSDRPGLGQRNAELHRTGLSVVSNPFARRLAASADVLTSAHTCRPTNFT